MSGGCTEGTDLYSDLFSTYDGAMPTIPLTEAKTRLNELVDEAVSTHERVTITKHGRPAVVLISVDDLEAIEETLYWPSRACVTTSRRVARKQRPMSCGTRKRCASGTA